MPVDGHPVILLTFAGRKDRMELLTHYVREALDRGLIDEWHVWNFSRNDHDDRWLRSQFPVVGRTPDNLVYYPAGYLDTTSDDSRRWRALVRAGNDVYVGIRPRYERAPSHEFVIGGWMNQRTVLRRLKTSDFFADQHDRRAGGQDAVTEVETPGILSPVMFRDLEIFIDDFKIRLSVDGSTVIEYDENVPQGRFDIYVKTGYGAEGEWRFPDRQDVGEYLYQSDQRSHAGWSELFNFYADRAAHYADSVIMKCDDDIVYIQLDGLEDFIRFRLRERQYFLVSANVVNNGVCAYHQQQRGAIPESLMRIEFRADAPPNIFSSAAMAIDLHNHFLDHRELFEQMPGDPIPWRGRFGINFVSWIGRDMSYMSVDMPDDEYVVCYRIPTYLGRSNCIFPRFAVSHLTFTPQDEEFDHEAILYRYRELAMANGFGARGVAPAIGKA